jgi:hypothetical protein
MNPNLFKSAEFYQRRYHNFATLLIVPLILLVGFLRTFSLFAKKEVSVTSRGEITPTTIIASIQSTSNNPITTKEFLITYYVTSEHVALLKEKQDVRLSLEKVGNQSITVIGKIKSIDKTATKSEEGNLFKVTALAQLSDKHGDIIQYGLQGRVTSIIAKKTYFDYYKDKILSNHD